MNQMEKALRTFARHDHEKDIPCHTIVKILSMPNKEKLLKAGREKTQSHTQM